MNKKKSCRKWPYLEEVFDKPHIRQIEVSGRKEWGDFPFETPILLNFAAQRNTYSVVFTLNNSLLVAVLLRHSPIAIRKKLHQVPEPTIEITVSDWIARFFMLITSER